MHAENRSHLYEPFDPTSNLPTGGYDSLSRLRQYQRGTLAATGGPGNAGGGTVAAEIALPYTNTAAQYDLDGLGNWRRFITDPVGGAENKQVRQHNGLNEILSVKDGTTDKVQFGYDGAPGASNGNLANDGAYKYAYDALNRLIEVRLAADDSVVAAYQYDALHRRVFKTVDSVATQYWYFGWRCVVEYFSGEESYARHYVWGHYLDELVYLLHSTAEGNTGYYPLQDLLYRTTALTDASGAIVEAYDYDAYGNTLIYNAPGTGSNWWADDASTTDQPACEFLFTGQRYDWEFVAYYYKMREYGPRWARFYSKDMMEVFGVIDRYTYVDNYPTVLLDPIGLTPYDDCLKVVTSYRQPLEDAINRTYENEKTECKESFWQSWDHYHPLSIGASGAAGIVAGQKLIAKRFMTEGTSSATSIASTLFSKWLPQRLPFRVWAPTIVRPGAMTNLFGRAIGRWVPLIGWGLLAIDAGTGIYAYLNPRYDEECLNSAKMKRDTGLSKLPIPENVCGFCKGISSLDPSKQKWKGEELEPPDWKDYPEWVRSDLNRFGLGAEKLELFLEAQRKMNEIKKMYGTP